MAEKELELDEQEGTEEPTAEVLEDTEGVEEAKDTDDADAEDVPDVPDVDPPKAEAEKAPKTKGPDRNELMKMYKVERKEVGRLQEVIQGLFEAMTAELSDEDKELLSVLGGDKADGRLGIYNKLKSAGKIGSKVELPEADRTRITAGDGSKAKPSGWKEADKRMARKLKSVR